jgi:hypothetical protein
LLEFDFESLPDRFKAAGESWRLFSARNAANYDLFL